MAYQSLRTGIEVDDSVRKAIAPSRLSAYLPLANPTQTVTINPGTPIKVSLPLTITKQNEFSFDGANSRFFLDASGVVDREFMFWIETNMEASVPNSTIAISIYINGVYYPGASTSRKISASGDLGDLGFSASVVLSDSDYIEIFVGTDASCQYTFSRATLNILELN